MKILAIETSCDETSTAIIENGVTIHANIVSSQINTHKKYGGVVPEIASRMHTEVIHTLINTVFEVSGLCYSDISAVAVTYGPGLEGSLLVGVSAAKSIAGLLNIPLIPINHLHGHIYANFLTGNEPGFPFICMIVSGGHTQLVLVTDHFEFDLLGETRDDAAGEAFDKIARFLDLGYPGGPVIEKEAKNGNIHAYQFPRAMLNKGLDFSFSGLKTAVIQTLRKQSAEGQVINKADVCASFQQAVIDTLVSKACTACKRHHINSLVLSGGVTANQCLKSCFVHAAKDNALTLYVPPKDLCTDNAAMIGSAAYYFYQKHPLSRMDIQVKPNLSI
ncbi:tRNA (adenosine(37)-N6)-threonylcarbamoyltransferase complex transferase subunit TsaD [Thermoproteota archaeon]